MKRFILSAAAVCLVATGCKEAPVGNNCLTKAEIEAGWELIFDGKTFNGWTGTSFDGIPNCWKIDDEALMVQTHRDFPDRQWGDIYFTKPYRNFEFTFDWKVAEGSNSGVFYLLRFIPGVENYLTCPEYQILDNVNHGDAHQGKDGNRQSASLYDMIPANPQNSKPFGEWNTGKIVVNGNHVEHYQNGVKVVEYTLADESWTARVSDSKFANSPMLEVGCEPGYIALQDHSDSVWYRNLKIRNLDNVTE